MLTRRHRIDYGILHSCTLDSMGHRFGHDCHEMDHAVYAMDGMLAAFLPGWRDAGYEVIVTADHGQTDRGHHGGHDDEMQDFALYYFGTGKGPEDDRCLTSCSWRRRAEASRRTGARDDEGQAVSSIRPRPSPRRSRLRSDARRSCRGRVRPYGGARR